MSIPMENVGTTTTTDESKQFPNLSTPTSSSYDLAKVPVVIAPKVLSPRTAATHHEAVDQIFTQLDDKVVSWFHIKTVIVAGMGFFCDSYDLFSISLVTNTIGRIYYPDTSYNCVPSLCAGASSTSTTTCLSKNCQNLLINVGIATGTSFNPGFDNTGRGWADQQPNNVQGNGIPSGDHNTWINLLNHRPSNMPVNTKDALLAVALCGTLVGQLLFGWLGDKYGRRQIFAFTLYIMITSCAAQAFSFGATATGVISTLLFFRFCLGMGVGGDYPLSATLMSEYSSKKSRGAFVGAVFAMQGIGYLAAATVAIIFSSIFDAAEFTGNPDHLWRIILSFCAIPTLATLYARLNLPETPRFTLFVNNNATQLVEDMNYVLAADRARGGSGEVVAVPSSIALGQAALAVVPRVLLPTTKISFRQFLNKYWVTLLGTASCWFFLDIAFYSQNLTQPQVFSTVGWLPSAYTMTITREAYLTARAQAIVALSSTVPGYWVTVFTVEYLGRRNIQFMGFFMMTLLMAILAGDYNSLVANYVPSFVAIYCLTFFFANWGPNATTFILPAEVFPTQYRTLGHGISAACGKAGAIVGTFGFLQMNTDVGLQDSLGLLTAVNAMGFLCTFLVPETKGKSLEELTDDHIIASKTKSLKDDDETERVDNNGQKV